MAIDTQMTVTPQVRKLETSANYGKFDIEPLDPGFGTTLGNTLRRVLLSSLWGAAVTSIQIDGVAHEFTAIPHVKEDVTEVILNLKKLCLKSFTEDPVTLILDVKGPAEVRASNIQTSSDVEIVNPDLYICTLAAKGHLRMELNVERGKGYVPADRNKREGQPIGVIPIDAIFSPVVKANFLVEKTRVGAFVTGASHLHELLQSHGIDTLIVTGTLTNCCCESTARDAMQMNYKVIFVSDATATFTDAAHNATLENMAMLFTDVMTTREVLTAVNAARGCIA